MYFPGKINQPPFLRTAVAEGKKKRTTKEKGKQDTFLAECKKHKSLPKSISWFYTKSKSLAI